MPAVRDGLRDRIPSQAAFDVITAKCRNTNTKQQRDGAELLPRDRERFRRIVKMMKRRACPPTRDSSTSAAPRAACFRSRTTRDSKIRWAWTRRRDARRRSNFYDIKALTGTLSDPADLRPPFDLVFLLGVLEHVRDVQAALARVGALLTPGGLVSSGTATLPLLGRRTTPRFNSSARNASNYFTPASLANAMRLAGFSAAGSGRRNRSGSSWRPRCAGRSGRSSPPSSSRPWRGRRSPRRSGR